MQDNIAKTDSSALRAKESDLICREETILFPPENDLLQKTGQPYEIRHFNAADCEIPLGKCNVPEPLFQSG